MSHYSKGDMSVGQCQSETMSLHIGGGVEIDQKIYPDTYEPTHWESQPFTTVVLNYVSANYLSALLEDTRLIAAQRLAGGTSW